MAFKKHTLRRKITALEIVVSLIVVAAIITGGILAYRTGRQKTTGSSSSAAPTLKTRTVEFSVNIPGLIGPACVYPIDVDSARDCFEPTDAQQRQMDIINDQGYQTIRIKGRAYKAYEVLHCSAVSSPGVRYEVLRIVKVDSMTGVGTKYQVQQ